MRPTTDAYVTPAPWSGTLRHRQYGAAETYRLAALWLGGCATVADWGGGTGYFGLCLPPTVQYLNVDGTQQYPGQVLADLKTYSEPSDGILLRHVLEHASDWRRVLANALQAYRRRLVLVTFTPDVEETRIVKQKSGWPVWHFNPLDLSDAMGAALVGSEFIQSSHPERVYYVERPQ